MSEDARQQTTERPYSCPRGIADCQCGADYCRRRKLPLPIEMRDAMHKAAMPRNPKYDAIDRKARGL